MRTQVTVTLLISLGAIVTGCAGPQHHPAAIAGSDAALRAIRQSVVQIESRTNVGSAIVIGENRVLTCRHTLPELLVTTPESLQMPNGTILRLTDIVTDVTLDGQRCRVKLLGVGDRVEPEHDWAVLEIVEGSLDRPAARLDGQRPVRPGETALAIGYWRGPSLEEVDPSLSRQWVVRSRIAQPVPFDRRENVIRFESGNAHSFNGMSGGALVVWDEESREFVVVGVYYGYCRWTVFGVPCFELQTARRVQDEWAETVFSAP